MKPKYWAIIILAAVAIGASAIYYAQQPAKDLSAFVIKHNFPKSPAPIIASNEFGDWKTYTNSKYGFEFKYPNNWDVASKEIIVGQTNYLNNYEIIHSTNGFGDFPSGIDFSLENNLAKLPIADWVSANIDNSNVIKVTKITVAEKQAIELTTIDRSVIDNSTYTEIYIPVMDKVLWFSANNDLKEVKDNLKSIISTFKFVPITADPSQTNTLNWKTYTNSEYGFEFKYPSALNKFPNNYSLITLQSTANELVLGDPSKAKGKDGVDYNTDGYEFIVNVLDKAEFDRTITTSAYSKTKLNIPNVEAARYDETGAISFGPVIAITNNKFLPNKVVTVSYAAQCVKACNVDDVDKIFNKILSTFKYLIINH